MLFFLFSNQAIKKKFFDWRWCLYTYLKDKLYVSFDSYCIFCLYYFFLRPDTSRIYVNIGFGFYVEFTHDEALKFIKKKTDSLNEKGYHQNTVIIIIVLFVIKPIFWRLWWSLVRFTTTCIYVIINYHQFILISNPTIKKKTDSLNEKAESFTKDAVTVKAHIKLVLEVSV
jgi:hypothetical protein